MAAALANVSSTYGQKCQYCPCTKYTIYLDEQQRQQEPHDSAPKTAASAFRCWGNGAGAAEGAVAGP